MALSIEECRKLLGTQHYTDKEIEDLRDALTAIARSAFKHTLQSQAEGQSDDK